VDGRIVVEDGEVLNVDEAALRAQIRGYASRLKTELEQMTVSADRLAPYYREMYLKAVSCDVGMNRWAGPMMPWVPEETHQLAFDWLGIGFARDEIFATEVDFAGTNSKSRWGESWRDVYGGIEVFRGITPGSWPKANPSVQGKLYRSSIADA
jgi:hypothetical protein